MSDKFNAQKYLENTADEFLGELYAIDELAKDYGLTRSEMIEIVRYFLVNEVE